MQLTQVQKRWKQFQSYASHPMLGKRYKEIARAGDLVFVHAFIQATSQLSIDEFIKETNRIARHVQKPKSCLAIEELLICTASALRGSH